MSRSAFSAKVFAVYLFFVGGMLAVVPNVLLPLFRLAPTGEVWVRILGVIAFNLGVYVWIAAKHENKPFLEASVVTRILAFAAFSTYVVTGLASPMIGLFAAIDLSGAIWTYLALRADARSPVFAGQAAH
jgi:hypothetical protein